MSKLEKSISVRTFVICLIVAVIFGGAVGFLATYFGVKNSDSTEENQAGADAVRNALFRNVNPTQIGNWLQ